MSIPTFKGDESSGETHAIVNTRKMFLRCVNFTEQAKVMFTPTKMTEEAQI
jgi:hypothetical protein